MWTTPLCVVSSWPHAGAVADTSQHIGYHHMRCARCFSVRQHSKHHDRRQHTVGGMPQRKKLNFIGCQCFVGEGQRSKQSCESSDIHTIVGTCHAHNLDSALVELLSHLTALQRPSQDFYRDQLEIARHHPDHFKSN